MSENGTGAHHHEWMVERPLRQVSRAWCWCGATGEFFNYGPQVNIRDRHQIKAERRAAHPDELRTAQLDLLGQVGKIR